MQARGQKLKARVGRQPAVHIHINASDTASEDVRLRVHGEVESDVVPVYVLC